LKFGELQAAMAAMFFGLIYQFLAPVEVEVLVANLPFSQM